MQDSIKQRSGWLNRLVTWLFSPRVLGRGLFVLACLVTLLALLYTEENWRGKRAWEQCRHELETKGINLIWAAQIPAPIPDQENVFAAPKMAEWFVREHTAGFSNELSGKFSAIAECLGLRSSNRVAEVTALPATANIPAEGADIVLHSKSGGMPGINPAEAETLRRVVHQVMRPSAIAMPGPRLNGAQGYTFVSQPPNPSSPVRVAVLASKIPLSKEVEGLFPKGRFATVWLGDDSLRIEPEGTNRFHVFLRHPTTCSAAEYLACSDEITPELDLIRNAVERPRVRREGDYSHPWGIPTPNYVALRTVAQTLSQRAQCYLLQGQPDKALREMTLLHDLRRLLEGKPMTLVAAMIHVAITGLYTSTIADGLRLDAWQDAQLVELQRQLADIHLLPQVAEAVDTQRISACSTLETTSPSDLQSIFSPGSPDPSLWSRLKDPAYYVDRLMPRGWIYQSMAAIASIEQRFMEAVNTTNGLVQPRRIEDLSLTTSAWLEGFSPGPYMARVFLSDYAKAFQRTARNQTMVNQALLACALQRYRLVHRQNPGNLEDLIPQFVDKIPLDIISGERLKYHRTDEGFLLYSVGWDEIDHGGASGKSASQGDWVWDEPKP